MRHMKKYASILLALVMALALAVPALAADNDGSITISNALEKETYKIYRILDLESYDTTTEAYAYKANSNWRSFLTSEEIKGIYVNVDTQDYVTWIEDADAAAFAAAAIKYATAPGTAISADGEKTAPADGDVSFTGLPLGYYLVDSTVGTLCNLTTTDPSVSITDKTEQPTLTKEVQEDSKANDADGGWGETNDADIGDTVNFRVDIAAKMGAQNYVMHDTMSTGLTYKENSVAVYTVEGENESLVTGNYTVTAPGTETGDKCTLEVKFDDTWLSGLTKNLSKNESVTIRVKYSATVNENAVIAGDGNDNKAQLTYGNAQETTEDHTTTYTWQFPIFKYTPGDEGAKNPLEGVEFVLSRSQNAPVLSADGTLDAEDDTNKANLIMFSNGKVVSENGSYTLTSDGEGMITVQGLDSDTYYLHEIKALDGYNKLEGPVPVEINNTGKINADAEHTSGVTQVEVENNSGTKLPETGGMGTKIFYVVGSVMALGAVVLLVTKRRMSSK